MSVLEDVVINAKSAAETVGKEAGRLVDISMLRFNAAETQKEISKKLENLGRTVYDCRRSGKNVDVSFDEQLKNIDALYQKLDEINNKINILRKKAVCPKCGFYNAEESVFCSRCGAKLADEKKETSSSPDTSEDTVSEQSDDAI